MPLTDEDSKVLRNFEREYGAKQGKRAFYASINAGRVKNIPEARRLKAKRRRKRKRRMV